MSDLVVETPTYTLVVEPLPTYQIVVGGGGTGPAGPPGPAGADGAPGATGATGAAGPSNVIVDSTPTTLTSGVIPDNTLIGRSGTSFLGRVVHDFAAKTAPVSTDELLLGDSAASNALKRVTVADLATAVGGGSGGSYPLWTPPARRGATPGAADIEFDSTTLPTMSIWDSTASATRTVAGNTVWRGSLPGSNPYMDAHTTNGGRESWLRIQLPNSNQFWLGFPVTVPTSGTFATRVKFPNTSTISSGCIRFGLFGATGGHIDHLNRVCTGFSSNMANLYTDSVIGGVTQAGVGNGDSVQRANAPPEYFWIEKDGTTTPPTYSLYAACADGTSIVCQQTYQVTFTPAYVGFFLLRTGLGGGSANPRFEIDFIRQTTTPFF